MNENIHNILNQLGNTIEAQIASANDRVAIAEAQQARLLNGLRALIGQTGSNDNHPDVAATEIGAAEPESKLTVPEKARSASRFNVPETAYLAALNSEWSGAADIRKHLKACEIEVAEGTVYNRMRKLALSHSDVESAAKPERWRLKAEKPQVTPKQAVKQATAADQSRPPRTRSQIAATAINDNASPLHQPVLHHGDCLEVMSSMADQSVDLILADLPYGVTDLNIDVLIDMDRLWAEYRRIIKPTGNIVLFGSQPFTTALVNAAPDLFKYSLVWEKTRGTGYLQCHDKPLKTHEDVLIFSPGTNMRKQRSARRATFHPVGASTVTKTLKAGSTLNYLNTKTPEKGRQYEGLVNCPRSVLKYPKDAVPRGKGHPFAKPVALLEYLIRAYSNPGEVVLDNTMGSGSTCVAAMRSGRRSIGIEQNEKWFNIARKRVNTERRNATNDNEESLRGTGPSATCKPEVEASDLKLYRGDCLDVMRTMPSGSVDLIFTSPPYNLGVSSGGGVRNSRKSGRWKNAALADGYASYDDARDPDEYIAWQQEVLRECWRLLSPTGAIFYQHKPRGQNKVLQTPLDLNPNLPVRQIIIWNRNNGFNFNSSYFLSTHEWIVVFAKPDFQLTEEGKRLKDVWTIKPERNNPHPAPFPVELPLTAIQATSAKVILDPFMGSGSTGVAALRCGREFIGIELDAG